MSGTRRQQAIRKAIRETVPLVPFSDAEPIFARASGATMKALPPSVAAWLAVTSHVRHVHTDYDALLAEGYDRDAARFFVREAMEQVLTGWGCRRRVEDQEADAE